MPGGRLLGAETQRTMSSLWFKERSQSLRHSASGHLREFLHVHFIRLGSKTVLYKVVAYRRWSLTRSGRCESVD